MVSVALMQQPSQPASEASEAGPPGRRPQKVSSTDL